MQVPNVPRCRFKFTANSAQDCAEFWEVFEWIHQHTTTPVYFDIRGGCNEGRMFLHGEIVFSQEGRENSNDTAALFKLRWGNAGS